MRGLTILLLSALTYPFSAAASQNATSSIDCTQECKAFTIDLTWGPTNSSHLISRDAILVNGSVPGPPLELDFGECVDFTVLNNLPSKTSVHFHGIRQLDTPWADGVPGLTQHGIEPGAVFNYRWTADAPGVYWYHSHYKGQMMDGFYGAIVIHPDKEAVKPWSLISNDTDEIEAIDAAVRNLEPIILSDWSEYTFDQFMQIQQSANIDMSCTDSIVMNGWGSSYCLSPTDIVANQAAQIPKVLNGGSLTAKGCLPPNTTTIQGAYDRNIFSIPAKAYDVCERFSANQNYTYTVDVSSKWAALSFINAAGFVLFKTTIDNHKLWVYEINGNFINPQQVDQVKVTNGDRISVLIRLDQPSGDYTIRASSDGINQVISGFGTLSYSKSAGPLGTAAMSYGGLNLTTIKTLNRSIAAPFPALDVSATADRTFNLDIMRAPTLNQSWSWILNRDVFAATLDDGSPLLYANISDVPASDLILQTRSNEWVDLIIQIAGPIAQPHPIHKHGNKFFVIGSGTGTFNFSSVAAAQAAGMRFNLVDPPFLDGYTSTPAEGTSSWMVFRYHVDTPGAWLLHCHVQTHISGGMAVAIMDAVDRFPTPPQDAGKLCNPNSTALNREDSADRSTSGAERFFCWNFPITNPLLLAFAVLVITSI